MWKTIYQETDWVGLKARITNGNALERRNALIHIKDAVIGSNRQKGLFITTGMVAPILEICTIRNPASPEKLDALIILGSVARGSAQQVEILVKQYNIIPLLINEIASLHNDKKCIEVCLSTMSSIYAHPGAPSDTFFMNPASLAYFLNLASCGSSLKTQISVISILVSLCHTTEDQMRFLSAGTIHVLARMIHFDNEHVQVPALRCLAAMCFKNRAVTDTVCVTSHQGRSLPDILNSMMSRLFTPEIQLTAAKCLSYVYRSGTLPSTDQRITHKTLPTLARLCSESYDQPIRAGAAHTLAYLIEVDAELQRTASISNHLLKSLSNLLQCHSTETKQAALLCFASLGANDEAIRKRIIDTSLIETILDGLGDNNTEVRLASIRCLHSLSRSVQQLRTTFQDHSVWKPLMQIINSQPSTVLLIAVTSTICNLLLEFSPSKDPLINLGIISKLCRFTEHKDAALRLNSVWGLMNMSFQADTRIKMMIIQTLTTKRMLELLYDADPMIVMKTLGMIRNLLSRPQHIDYVMGIHSLQVLEALYNVFNSDHASEVKEQGLCIIGNIAAEANTGDYIVNDENIMRRLGEFLFHPDPKLQAGALFAINNIVHRKDVWSEERYMRLSKLDIIKRVRELSKKTVRNKMMCEDYIYRTLKKIVIQCKHYCPENMR